MFLAIACLSIAEELCNLAPVYYDKAQTDNAVSRLQRQILTGKKSIKQPVGKDFLLTVLKELDVPVESQVLVFSKTSLQTKLISHSTPRAIYFSDTTYVGYVPGGTIEIAVHDANLGIVFYTVRSPFKKDAPTRFKRHVSCLTCHSSSRTEGIPGVFVRSVTVDSREQVVAPSYDTNHKSPFSERWGGWYVTGEWSENLHMGNKSPFLQKRSKESLQTIGFLSSYYPRKTSDVAALTILEHQCFVQNLLVAAKMEYQRAMYLEGLKDEQVNGIDQGKDQGRPSDKLVDRHVEKTVEAMLFYQEAPLKGDGLDGSPTFIKAFQRNAKKSSQGKSLKDLRLYNRIFKYRCSYMIYSATFRALPSPIKNKVLKRIHDVLTEVGGDEKFQYLKSRERKSIHEILTDTVPEYAQVNAR